MSEEIKRILDIFTKYKDQWYSVEYILKPKQCVLLLDYITNLQQENERLKENYNAVLKQRDDVIKNATETIENNINYKSRCEKATEYIKKLSNKPNVFGHYGIDTECKKWLLKILNGSDENE